jgi:hypothetical protein
VADSVEDYRKRVEAELIASAERRANEQVSVDKAVPAAQREAALPAVVQDPDDIAKAVAIVLDPAEDRGLRQSVLQRLGIAVGESHELIGLVLGLSRNAAEPAALRLVALRILQQADFTSALFRSRRPDYLAALREIAGDEHSELREQALEILAIKKDEYAQRILLDGLRTPSAAVVPPEKAVQMLGYDVHAEHYPILREMVQNPPNPAAKEEAVRLLAGDPGSQQLLTQVLTDKSESAEVRKLSAAALRWLAPDAFAEQAKRIVVDEDESDDVRAACLTALINAGDRRMLRADIEFTREVERLQDRSPDGEVARSAAMFLEQQKKG